MYCTQGYLRLFLPHQISAWDSDDQINSKDNISGKIKNIIFSLLMVVGSFLLQIMCNDNSILVIRIYLRQN